MLEYRAFDSWLDVDSGRDFPLCANDEMRAGFSSGTDGESGSTKQLAFCASHRIGLGLVASRYTHREASFSDADDFLRIQVRFVWPCSGVIFVTSWWWGAEGVPDSHWSQDHHGKTAGVCVCGVTCFLIVVLAKLEIQGRLAADYRRQTAAAFGAGGFHQ